MNFRFLSRRRSHLECIAANCVRGNFDIPEYTTGQEVLRSPEDLVKAVTALKLLWDTAKFSLFIKRILFTGQKCSRHLICAIEGLAG